MSPARSVRLAGALLVLALAPHLASAADPARWLKVKTPRGSNRAALAATPEPEVVAKEPGGDDYVLVRGGADTAQELRRRGLQVSDATQSDFVQNFHRLTWRADEQKAYMLRAGLDLIEFDAKARKALVRATHGDVRRLRARGIEVTPRDDLDRRTARALEALRAAPNAGAYHTFQEVRDELKALASNHPDRARVHDLGSSVQGRSILAIEIGGPQGAGANPPQVLILGCHHAREWISVEVPLRLAVELVNNPGHSADVESLVKSARVWIIPMLNPDGHQYTVEHDRMWRKNLRDNQDGTLGVDLNRNYDGPNWGDPSGSSSDTSDETYHGPAPFSEPETRIVRDLVTGPNRLGQLRGLVTYHSYSQLILYPWGYTEETAPSSDGMRLQSEKYRDLITAAGGVSYTAEQASALYLTNGDTTDWAWKVTNNTVPALTVELRPLDDSGGGFILPESQIEPTWNENRPAILSLLKLWTAPAPAINSAPAVEKRTPSPSAVPPRSGPNVP
jgi:carboxypeptidase T